MAYTEEGVPFQGHSDTSAAAAHAVTPDANTLRRIVFEFLTAGGKLTDEDMQLGIPMNPSTQRPRRVELVNKGLVEDSGERKRVRSGRMATLWQVKAPSDSTD